MKKWIAAGVGLLLLVVPVLGVGVVSYWMALLGSSAAQQSACVAPVGGVPALGGPVRMPASGRFTVTSEYGMRENPGDVNHGVYRLHAGIDLVQPVGAVVVAAKAGVVSATPDDVSGGTMVVIDHGGGLTTKYLHLAKRNVQVGQTVWAGASLGVEGGTGNATGQHLHFEVHQSGAPQDPRVWLADQDVHVPALGESGTGGGVELVAPAGFNTGLQPQPAFLDPGVVPEGSGELVGKLPQQVGVWNSEQVQIAAQVIKAGLDRDLDAKTITIAVMVGMAESSLQNLPHGDSVRNDTIGVFQEGPERGTYAQRMDPYSAAGIFYDYLLRVPGYLDLEPTIAAHKAQANADPYHYEPRWPEAVEMVANLTDDPELLASLPAGGPVTGCENGGPAPLGGSGDGSGQAIVDAAQHYLGTPYSWGGGDINGPSLGVYSSPSLDGTSTVGFDCSGLILFAVHHATGITLPHDAEAQGKDPRGTVIPRDWAALQPGDVISFSEDGTGAPGSFGHVGIYLGGGKMIHAPVPGRSVETVDLRGSAYFKPMHWNIRRYAT